MMSRWYVPYVLSHGDCWPGFCRMRITQSLYPLGSPRTNSCAQLRAMRPFFEKSKIATATYDPWVVLFVLLEVFVADRSN